MSAITNELGVVAKNLNVDMGKGKSYKAVQEKEEKNEHPYIRLQLYQSG